jgi:hypothetical protein
MTKKIGSVLFVLSVAVSLGYGAQAAASPAEPDPFYCTTREERIACYNLCTEQGLFADCSHTYGCICKEWG